MRLRFRYSPPPIEAVGQGEIEVLAGLAAGDKVVTDPLRAAIQIPSGK